MTLRNPNHIESLETRRLLAATVELTEHGLLKVTGTDAGETISLALNSDSSKVEVKVDGTVVGSEAVGDVHGIFVDAGAGDDTVTVGADITQRVGVVGGDGN